MKYFRWFSLMMVFLSLSINTTGCVVKKQVRYTSGPPNVAVSVRTLHHSAEPQPEHVTFSNDTRYVHVNEASQ